MATVIHSLKEAGYTGPLTLEIDDLNFPHPLSADDKMGVLSRDRAFIHECLE
jgi:sugar phosphate isomerase/epimerase